MEHKIKGLDALIAAIEQLTRILVTALDGLNFEHILISIAILGASLGLGFALGKGILEGFGRILAYPFRVKK